MQLWTIQSNLLLAIQDNDLQAVEDILTSNLSAIDADITFNLGYGTAIPAICLAVERGLYDMVKLFLRLGCSVNATDSNGFTALHVAVSHQFVDIVQLLLTNRANVNAVSNNGRQTPLHVSCQQSSVEIVATLVTFGADIDRKDADGRTPLCIACACNQTDIVELLVSVYSKTKTRIDVNSADNMGNTPLLYAVNAGLSLNVRMVKLLLEAGADPNCINHLGLSPLITTIRRSSESSLNGIEAVTELIHHGCDINVSSPKRQHRLNYPVISESPLHLSITRGQDRITELLVRSGADLNDRNDREWSPLHRVAREEKVDLVKMMLAAGAGAISPPKTFFIDEEGVRRDIQNPEIRTLLHMWAGRRVPPLKHIIRTAIRRRLERKADSIIRGLQLPRTLKDYLLLHEI